MCMDCCNPDLHRRLDAAFGEVKVQYIGQHFRLGAPDLSTGRKEVLSWGEGYRVNCPFCRGGHCSLWICHQWAQRVDGNGFDDMLWAAKCSASNCLSDPAKRERLLNLIYPEGRLQPTTVLYSRSYAPPSRKRRMPPSPRKPSPSPDEYVWEADDDDVGIPVKTLGFVGDIT